MTGQSAVDTVTQDFLDAMADVAAPVSVVTTAVGPISYGTTVSAFCSLSLHPAMVLVSLDNTSRLLSRILASNHFGLNVLADDQAHLARRFASKGENKFDGVDFDLEHGAPRLAGATAWVMCEVAEAISGGDHTVLFGRAIHASAVHLSPLTYHSRSFGTHSVAA